MKHRRLLEKEDSMPRSLHVLILEDCEDDALLAVHELKKGGYDIVFERLETAESLKSSLQQKKWDVIISDYNMPHFNGAEALRVVQKEGLDIPFILFSGTIGDEKAAAIMKAGAHDFIKKGNLARLVPAVERELKEAEERCRCRAAEAEVSKLLSAIEQSLNIIFITDNKGNIEFVNPMFETVTGWSREEAIGKNPHILSSGETPKKHYGELWETILAGKTFTYTFKNKRKDGTHFWVNSAISPIKDKAGKITHFLAVQEDISEKRRSEEKIEYLATHDYISGLPNRTQFMDLASESLLIGRRENRQDALLFINLDGFKFINEVFGFNIGNQTISLAARLIERFIHDMEMASPKNGRNSVIGSMGGDEFAVYLPACDSKEAVQIAEELRKQFETFRPVPEKQLTLTVSIGIALFPEHGLTITELFSKVDTAILRAKREGKNRAHLFSEDDKDLEKTYSRLQEKEFIQKALQEDRFEPFFQPILSLKNNEITLYEVLARMRTEEEGYRIPGAFIETAEMFGLISEIDKVIIKKAVQLQTELQKQSREVAILFDLNLSGKELGDKELLLFLQSLFSDTGADPHKFIFEITETAAVRDMAKAIKFIDDLKSIGCRFALDDFGVGFTSFAYLKELHIDYLKIDGYFIKNLPINKEDQLFVKAIADVAKGMGIKTIAEFTESEETINILKGYGIDYAQGYAVGKPMPQIQLQQQLNLR